MKTRKILMLLLALISPGAAGAVDNAIDSAWGKPQTIKTAWGLGKGFDNGTRYPDTTYWIMPKHHPDNADDESVIMIYAARVMVQHGGYFCATQARSRNSGSGCPKIWTQYQNPSGNYTATCFWLCEPGYTGENCKSAGTPSAGECKYTKLNAETLQENIGFQETGGYDTATVESAMKANNYQGFFRWNAPSNKHDESDVVLAAKSFLENGHGIIASPATVAAHGGWWTKDDYSDQTDKCGSSHSDLTVTDRTGNYTTKTLCMPGFSGPNCTTSVCKECEDPLARFDDATGYCSACIENHIRNADGLCEICPEGTTAVPERNICLECKKTEYVKDGQCVPRQPIAKNVMHDCWPNHDVTDFAMCIQTDCNDGESVACLIAGGGIGKKTCSAGKWNKCENK